MGRWTRIASLNHFRHTYSQFHQKCCGELRPTVNQRDTPAPHRHTPPEPEGLFDVYFCAFHVEHRTRIKFYFDDRAKRKENSNSLPASGRARATPELAYGTPAYCRGESEGVAAEQFDMPNPSKLDPCILR